MKVDLSLHDIEHGIIRSRWKNIPEVHYALNCASKGCPEISKKVYQGSTLPEQLKDAAKGFFANSSSIKFKTQNRVSISKIFNWYRKDFGSSTPLIIHHIREYLPSHLKSKLDHKTKIRHYFYDWSLNEL